MDVRVVDAAAALEVGPDAVLEYGDGLRVASKLTGVCRCGGYQLQSLVARQLRDAANMPIGHQHDVTDR
ncbi:MAG TPA: hypothetical protein VGY30_02300 [Solirubrobacteraceae bacterium]|nr:hypothetical protein [Solirubrobacteraceae bacterium]